jgi:prolyl 4-hydroxylase
MTSGNEPTSVAPANDLRDFIRVYDEVLPATLCEGLINGFEQMRDAQVENGRGVRGGLEGSRWTELNLSLFADAAMKGYFLGLIDKYLAIYNEQVHLGLPIPPSARISELMIKRYSASQEDGFQPHFDSIYEKSNRYLVFLWYLNTVDEGGETRFTDLGVDVQAKKGRLLVFPPYWMYQHAGLSPRSNDKYILSTYLLFERNPGVDLARPPVAQ